jgi:hypothetical protein
MYHCHMLLHLLHHKYILLLLFLRCLLLYFLSLILICLNTTCIFLFYKQPVHIQEQTQTVFSTYFNAPLLYFLTCVVLKLYFNKPPPFTIATNQFTYYSPFASCKIISYLFSENSPKLFRYLSL